MGLAVAALGLGRCYRGGGRQVEPGAVAKRRTMGTAWCGMVMAGCSRWYGDGNCLVACDFLSVGCSRLVNDEDGNLDGCLMMAFDG